MKTDDNSTSKNFWSTARQWIVVAIACITISAAIVHVTVRDHFPLISVFYYATPLALQLIGSLTMVAMSFFSGRRIQASFWTFLTVCIAIVWLTSQWRFVSRPEDESDIVVLFANTSRAQAPEALIRLIRKQNPDVVGLVETQRDKQKFWEAALPGYHAVFANTTMKLLAKTPLDQGVSYEIGHGTVVRECAIDVRGQTLLCQIVDVTSNPFWSRQPMLDRLAQMAQERAKDNLLIMGDFNTPPESVHFRVLREQQQNLFEAAGHGYQATWPTMLPVLALDQIWINRNFEPVSCDTRFTLESDHRVVLGRVRVVRK